MVYPIQEVNPTANMAHADLDVKIADAYTQVQ